MIKEFGKIQLVSIALGLLFGAYMLIVTVQEYLWARQPLIKAFYAHDVLNSPHDEDGLFRAPAFDRLTAIDLPEARLKLEQSGFSCEPVVPAKQITSCHYGYETQTGCCRFRVELRFDAERQVMSAHGDKTGRCPR